MMGGNGRAAASSNGDGVLHWQGRVVAAEDLRRQLNGHRELVLPAGAVVTPLAAEELRNGGVRVTRRAAEAAKPAASNAAWGFAQDHAHAAVQSAVQALRREGLAIKELDSGRGMVPCHWARQLAECVGRGECVGGVVFCPDPGLVCCVANKVAGLRAAAVVSAAQAARATLGLGANLVAVEMPGRTFFEVRQILRTLCTSGGGACPEPLGSTLRELDGHAHR